MDPHFVSKHTDADGEQMETQYWTRVAFSCGYLDESTARSLITDLEQIGGLLEGMTDKAESFCSSPRVAESHPPLDDEDAEDPLFTDLPITDYRLPITDHFPFASTASAVLLPLDVPLLLSNHIPE